MQLNPYLFFNGQCEAAFKFYEQVLGGKIEGMMTHAGTPAEEHVPAEWRDKILHARLIVGDNVLMASDAPPGRYEEAKGFSVSIQLNDLADAECIFHALAEKGTVQMPFAATFWSPGFGMCVDRFGIPWMVNCERVA
jgi:PhnB protein